MMASIANLVGLFLWFGVGPSCDASAGQKKWDLAIEIPKTTFVSLEPIWLDVTLTNIGRRHTKNRPADRTQSPSVLRLSV